MTRLDPLPGVDEWTKDVHDGESGRVEVGRARGGGRKK